MQYELNSIGQIGPLLCSGKLSYLELFEVYMISIHSWRDMV